jgi:hypothetical protein
MAPAAAIAAPLPARKSRLKMFLFLPSAFRDSAIEQSPHFFIEFSRLIRSEQRLRCDSEQSREYKNLTSRYSIKYLATPTGGPPNNSNAGALWTYYYNM